MPIISASRQKESSLKCPYYRKVDVENHPDGLKAYCEGDQRKGLRVPSLFETHYCTTLQYLHAECFKQARDRSNTSARDLSGPMIGGVNRRLPVEVRR